MGIIRDSQRHADRRNARVQTELLRRMADQEVVSQPPLPPVLPAHWHALHVTMTLLTGGLWGIVWVIHYTRAKSLRRKTYGR